MMYPKILIVSHNALSNNGNMGRTIASYIKRFPKECVAQLFLHEGNPNSECCNNYYKFTDKDALKSILFRWHKGEVLHSIDSSTSKAALQKGGIYNLGRKRKPIVSIAREIMWSLSNSFNRKLKSWLNSFNPDVIFFACSDYKYSYKLTRKIARFLNKPLVLCCFDDYYIHCHYSNQIFGKLYYKSYMKEVRKTFAIAKLTFAFNEEMSQAYFKLFNRDFPVLYTGADCLVDDIPFEEKKGISYLGGLEYNRYKQLIELGKALKELKIEGLPNHIDVYSPENSPEVLRDLTNENGINFHGGISHDEVIKVITHSKAIIHVESFDYSMVERTRYSISTKIPESLASGTLLIALGPKDVASMKYLIKHDAAVASDDIKVLIPRLSEVLLDKNKYYEIIDKAKKLYLKNHTIEGVSNVFLSEINKVLE